MKTGDIKKQRYVKLSDLARVCDVKYSTLLHYKNLELLPTTIPKGRKTKYFITEVSIKIVQRIKRLRKSGKSLCEIKNIMK
jgi:DNA-binding transcriptional MerR regulator